ncbi:serine/threonine-protein kinase [Marinimicrobium locisalis]|uniref:serine/threonine-protein kinase n=1 Tax=Marinimicrobium locisalis TaxID=546022 RepID=UPI0032215047
MNSTLTERLADRLSLRTLILVLGAWLAFAPPQTTPLLWLDQALFQVAVSLTPARVRYDEPAPAIEGGWQPFWPAVTGYWAERQKDRFIADLNAASGYRTPWWFYPGFSTLTVLFALYLLWLVPGIGRTTAILTTVLLTVALVAAQLGAQISRGYWLPMGLALQYLWAGLLMAGAHWAQRRWVRQTRFLWRQLGTERFQNGYWLKALEALRHCPTSDSLLDQLYHYAREHERCHRWPEAQVYYRELNQRQPGYRDVQKRLDALRVRREHTGSQPLAQTQPLEELAVPKKLGRYEIERELGRGAMGVVYLGRDPHIARQLAIKTLNVAPVEASERGGLKARFFREAEAAGRLRHPNIVTVYDVGEEGDLAFIAMDYIGGEPLSRHAAKGRLLTIKRVYELMAKVADALAYAHKQEVVHRDIKPGNILYAPREGRVVVTDFGIARVANSARTQTGEIMGSPLYMSPEQLKGVRVGPSSDIFSLGVTLYQLLTGELPFRGDTIAELSYQIVQSRHRPVREARKDLPRSATRIVNKTLQKDPQKRYANAGELAKALKSALEKEF